MAVADVVISPGTRPELPVIASRSGPSSSSNSRFYRPELDVLRFVAFFLVFLHHSLPRDAGSYAVVTKSAAVRDLLNSIAGGGGFGLCLFFTLSAYLITELLQRETAKTGTVAIASFYKRRILRIWPLYFLGLLGGSIYMATSSTVASVVGRFAAFAFFAGNWYFARYGYLPDPGTPLWSISVEEQFYLLWPWIMRRSRKLAYVTAISAIPVAYLAMAYLVRAHENVDHQVWTNTFVQFLMFSSGALAALALRSRVPSFQTPVRFALVSCAILLWLAATWGYRIKDLPETPLSFWNLLISYSFISLGSLLLLLGVLGTQLRMPAVLVQLGKVSYGLYVYHVFCILAVEYAFPRLFPSVSHASLSFHLSKGLTALLLTVLCARLSYEKFESIFLRAKERLSVVQSRPI